MYHFADVGKMVECFMMDFEGGLQMSNEEKILEKLEKMSSDMDALKARVAELERGNGSRPSIDQQLNAIDGLSHLLDEDEKRRFGAFMDAEEARKAAVYG